MRSYRVHSHSDLVVGQPAALDERSSHHLARVLRVKLGDAVTVFNGDGNNYFSRVSALSKTRVDVDLISSESPANESPLTTLLGLAVSKGDRFDWAIKKATELGVSSISPILRACGCPIIARSLEKKARSLAADCDQRLRAERARRCPQGGVTNASCGLGRHDRGRL